MADKSPLQLIEDHIAQHLREAEASGELRHAPSFGRPLQLNDGYDETPPVMTCPAAVVHSPLAARGSVRPAESTDTNVMLQSQGGNDTPRQDTAPLVGGLPVGTARRHQT